MNIPDYDIMVQPIYMVLPDGWKSLLDKYLSDKDYSLEQYLEDEYQAHKEEYAKQLMRSIL